MFGYVKIKGKRQTSLFQLAYIWIKKVTPNTLSKKVSVSINQVNFVEPFLGN